MSEIKSNKRAQYRRRYAMLDDISLKIGDAARRISGATIKFTPEVVVLQQAS